MKEKITFDDVNVGDELLPCEFVLSEELIERYEKVIGTNSFYSKDSPFGCRIAPPSIATVFLLQSFYARYPQFKRVRSRLHVKQEFEFLRPLKAGQKFVTTGKIVNRYFKSVKKYTCYELVYKDMDGNELVKAKYYEMFTE